MSKTARVTRRLLIPVLLAVAAIAPATNAAASGPAVVEQAAAAVHADGVPCMSCGG